MSPTYNHPSKIIRLCVRYLLLTLFGVAAIGCGVQDEIAAQKQKWQNEGWTFVEVVGKPVSGARYIAHMTSPNATTVTAFASATPHPNRKPYDQTDRIYLIVTMGVDSMNTFSLVFSKPKPIEPGSL